MSAVFTDAEMAQLDRVAANRDRDAEFARHHPEYQARDELEQARDDFRRHGWGETAAGELAELHVELHRSDRRLHCGLICPAPEPSPQPMPSLTELQMLATDEMGEHLDTDAPGGTS